MSSLGVFVSGGDPTAITAFETWLGADVDFVSAHTGKANWSDWQSSIGWLGNKYASIDADLNWTIPMFANGGTLAAAAAGDYDAYYAKAAETLAALSVSDEKIYVRVGEEFNGGWMSWAAKGKEGEFIEAYRNFVDAFRSVSDKFVFEWNVAAGDNGMNPATAYPGDAYVDIISMDFYYNIKWDNADPEKAWESMVTRKYGLQWLEDFADAHNKPTAYSEWGVNADNAGAFITKAFEWFESHDVVHQNYWNSNSAFAGMLSDGGRSGTGAVYKALFATLGDQPVVTTPVVTTPADNTPVVAPVAPAPTTDGVAVHLTGGAAGDVLDGGVGADTLDGGYGDDVLKGAEGADVLSGGVGNDWIHGNQGADLIDGGAGFDTIYGGQNEDTISGGDGDDWMQGNKAADVLDGGAGTDTIYGGADDDALKGGDGNDWLKGDLGLDTLNGGTGDDTINGGAGDDVLTGGSGADNFVFEIGAGKDVITDFSIGDRIDLSAYLNTGQQATLEASGPNVLIHFASGDLITLLGVSTGDLHATSFGYQF